MFNFKVVAKDDERALLISDGPGGGGLDAPVQNPYRLRREADAARTS